MAAGLTKQCRCDAKTGDQEVKTARQRKERPLKTGLFTKAADFRDELCRRQGGPAGERRHFKDGAPIDGSRRYRADYVFDRRIEVTFGEESIVQETKASGTENLVTLIQKGDDPRRESLKPRAISSLIGVPDELLGWTPESIIIYQKGCLHLAYRSRDRIDAVLQIICDRSLFRNSQLYFRMLRNVSKSHVFGAMRTHYASRLRVLGVTLTFHYPRELAWRHRSIVPNARSQNFDVTP